MLSFIIWFPVVVALVLLIVPIREAGLARSIALGSMLLVLLVSLYVFQHLAVVDAEYAFEVRHPWIPSLQISYHLGVQLLGATLILLTSLVGVAAIGVSGVTKNARCFYALGLLMIGGMIGAFASLDLFFLYIFHEFALIPTFILIGVWGAERRRHAAIKITLYLALGSLILLIGLLSLYWYAGGNSFDILVLRKTLEAHPIAVQTQIWIFGLLFLGFGILISMFPLHTWAPIGYGEAPPLASMLHAGVIKKFGFYGLIAVAMPLLPAGFEYWRIPIAWVASMHLIYCGYVALQQKDLRYMVAYSSVSHMGYAFLAFASQTSLALQGLTLFLFAHGLSAAAGFGIVGCCREKTGTSEISEMGGLAAKMPFAATVFTMVALAGSGLPGFANFPSELLIFMGSFSEFRCPTILAVWTAVISAVYFLRAIRNVFLGEVNPRVSRTDPFTLLQRASLILLLLASLIAGFLPRWITGKSVTELTENNGKKSIHMAQESVSLDHFKP